MTDLCRDDLVVVGDGNRVQGTSARLDRDVPRPERAIAQEAVDMQVGLQDEVPAARRRAVDRQHVRERARDETGSDERNGDGTHRNQTRPTRRGQS